MLKGERVFLRPVEMEDAPTIAIWENNPENWRVTNTEAPYSLQAIIAHIENVQNIRQTGELRLLICLSDSEKPIGTVDLNNVDFKHDHAEVGILIGDTNERGKGYAQEALELLIDYADKILALHNLIAYILEDNTPSIHLFQSVGFELVGSLKEWFLDRNGRTNIRIYQLCIKKEN